MNDPTQTPLEILISPESMRTIMRLPPGGIDQFAHTLNELRHNPDNLKASAFVPIPVDHDIGRERTYVPATRSISYLRGAVADISPPTVAHFDQELQEATAYQEETGTSGQIRGLRDFVLRWVDYISIQGDHPTARRIDNAANADEALTLFSQAMSEAHRVNFPDAGPDPHTALDVRTIANRQGGYTAICPITTLRAQGPTEAEATRLLRGMLMEWITG